MSHSTRGSRSGFTLVELMIVVVISSFALVAIYQSLITQQQTYRRQSAAIDAQGTARVGLQVLTSDLRELSTVAGEDASNTGGSDLVVAAKDSIRIRAFRKAGIVCNVAVAGNILDVHQLGTAFTGEDSLLVYGAAADKWIRTKVASVGSPTTSACTSRWSDYPAQGLVIPSGLASSFEQGAIVRSFETLTYKAYKYGGDWVLGLRGTDGSLVPLVGPIISPDSGGLAFTYYNSTGTKLTPSTQSELAKVARINIVLKALSHGGGTNGGNYVDSLTTNVYLRGN